MRSEASPRAEDRRAPPADVADAMFAPAADVAALRTDSPRLRAEERSWADVRGLRMRRGARRVSLENCIVIVVVVGLVFCFCFCFFK